MFVTNRLPVAAAGAAILAAVVGIAGGPVGWIALLVGNLLILLALFLDYRSSPAAETLRLRRELPETASLGQHPTIAINLQNPLGRPLLLWISDSTSPSLRRDPKRHELALAPHEVAVLEADMWPSRRGNFVIGPLTVRTAGRFGLGGRQTDVPLLQSLKVYPALPGRAAVELRLDRARLLQVGERSSNIRGGGSEFDSLREYHQDDEFRRINWKATARSGKAISNTFREERNQQVILLFDAGRMMAATVAGTSRFEHAIDAGMAVAQLASRVGDHIGMVAFGRQMLSMLGPRSGKAQPRRILDSLFDMQPSLDASNYREAFSALLTRNRRRALLILLTELTEESAMESLFAAVPVLISRHLLMIGSVQDPSIEGLARSLPITSADAYRKAAAVHSLAARERSASRLLGMGVRVVDKPPDRLAAELADGYLRIKALGRL